MVKLVEILKNNYKTKKTENFKHLQNSDKNKKTEYLKLSEEN